MTRPIHAIAFALLLIGTSGCSTFQPAPLPASFIAAEKALTVAENAHAATGVILEAAAKTGVLHGQNAATAKAYYDQAGSYLDQAEAAKTTLTSSDLLAAVANAYSLLGKASTLAQGGN